MEHLWALRLEPSPSSERGGHHAPQLWRRSVVLVLFPTLALAALAVAFYGLSALRAGRFVPPGRLLPADLEVMRSALTLAAFFGAVLAGVYAYRKQRLEEAASRRADSEQLAKRYIDAAQQMGHTSAAVRLAGAYAMAQLADDWSEQRQSCIDVLCAYLRLPYDPDSTAAPHPVDKEVRRTLIRIIRDHLRPGRTSVSWDGHNFSFEGATFDVGDLSGVRMTDGHISFYGARFVGDYFLLSGADFAGVSANFERAVFDGRVVSFDRANFRAGDIRFQNSELKSGAIRFAKTRFTGARADFSTMRFSGGQLVFDECCFIGGTVSFTELGAAGDGGVTVKDARAVAGVLQGLPGVQFSPPGDSDFVAAGHPVPGPGA